MRIHTNRVTILLAASFGLGLSLLWVSADAAAQKVAQPLPIAEPPTPPQPAREIFEKLSFPEDRDTSQKFEAVTDYMKSPNPDWPVVVKLAQGLLDAKSDYFYQYNANSTDPKKDKRRVSVKDEMSRLIGTFPKDGRDFYQLTYGPVADTILKDAKKDGLDIAKLSEVSQKFFHTKAGAEGALLLASLNLELGNYPEAAYGFQRLLNRPDTDAILDAKSLFKAVVAFKRASDGRVPEIASGIWDRIEKKFPRDGVKVGNRVFTLDEMKVEANRPIEFLFGKVGDAYVAMLRGNATRASVAEAGPPFLDAIFGGPILFRTEGPDKSGSDWVKQNVDVAYRQAQQDKKKVLIPAGFPVTAPNLIMYRGYDGAYAFYSKDCVDPSGKPRRAGDLAWFSPTHGGAQSLYSDDENSARKERSSALSWWQTYWNTQMPSILFENSLLGSISHDGKLAYYIDDLAVLPQPNNWGGDP